MNKRLRSFQSPKHQEKKRKRKALTILLFSFCILILLFAIILFIRLPSMQISKIQVYGNTTISTDSIVNDVMRTFEGNYLGILPRSSILFFSKGRIKDSLINNYKNIDKLDIHYRWFSGIDVNIVEKLPSAIVCDGFYDENNENQRCYSLDKDGYIYGESPIYSEGVFTHYYTDNIDNGTSTNIIGSQFLNTDTFKRLQALADIIVHNKIYILGILVNDNGQYELYIKNPDTSAAIVYFDDKSPFDKTAANLVAFWNNMIHSKSATSTVSFEYINLRYGNNIFYVTK